MSRTVVIHATLNSFIGDETYETWLKHETDAWALIDAGPVVDSSGTQSFTLVDLVDGANYSVQLRMKRSSRYRVGYLSSDPETWPSGSRLDFTVGSLIDVGAPTLTVDTWVRTSAVAAKIPIHIVPDDTTKNIDLYRNGVLLHTFVAPLASTIDWDDVNPTLGAYFLYKAHHVAGTLSGPDSATIGPRYGGPEEADSFVRTTPDSTYGHYTVTWTNDGRSYRIQDNYHCASSPTAFVDMDSGNTVGTLTVTKGSGFPGTTAPAFFQIRIRAEVTAFGITDLSPWTLITGATLHDVPDSTGYNTCT